MAEFLAELPASTKLVPDSESTSCCRRRHKCGISSRGMSLGIRPHLLSLTPSCGRESRRVLGEPGFGRLRGQAVWRCQDRCGLDFPTLPADEGIVSGVPLRDPRL